MQSAWLLPALDARVAMQAAGVTPPTSAHHAVYVGCELLKLFALLACANLGFTPAKQGQSTAPAGDRL